MYFRFYIFFATGLAQSIISTVKALPPFHFRPLQHQTLHDVSLYCLPLLNLLTVPGVSDVFMNTGEYDLLLTQLNDISMWMSKTHSRHILSEPCQHASPYKDPSSSCSWHCKDITCCCTAKKRHRSCTRGPFIINYLLFPWFRRSHAQLLVFCWFR